MSVIAKQCFLFIRLWQGLIRRTRYIYYKIILGNLGHHSVIGGKVLITHPYNVFIGEDTTVNECTIIQGHPEARVRIGNRVSISYNALILTASRFLRNGFYCKDHQAKTVIIEDDVWIAAKSAILPGVTIGARSVVAAGAVVTGDVEPDTIVAGIPARPIRHLKSENDS